MKLSKQSCLTSDLRSYFVFTLRSMHETYNTLHDNTEHRNVERGDANYFVSFELQSIKYVEDAVVCGVNCINAFYQFRFGSLIHLLHILESKVSVI